MRRRFVLFLLASRLLVPAPGATADSMLARIETTLRRVEPSLVEFRRDLHRHPESSGNERRTAAKVAARLKALGWDVRRGVGGHGVVATLRGSHPGPAVAFRADMDAVRSNDHDPVDFASVEPGLRHICGHDVHTAVGIGVAEALSPLRGDLHGSVLLIFQPSEENAEGAKAMLRDGVFRDSKPAAIFALHTAPLEVGTIGSMDRLVLPGSRQLTLVLSGAGNLDRAEEACRAFAIESATVDDRGRPRAAAAEYRASTPEGGRGADPSDFVPHTEYLWTHALPDVPRGKRVERRVRLVLKTGGPEALQKAVRRLEAGWARIVPPGVVLRTTLHRSELPATVNDFDLVTASRAALEAAVGEGGIVDVRRVPPQFGEDFAWFQREVPGAMYFLGVSNSEAGIVGMPHSPGYAADDGAIVVGAKAMANLLVGFLERARSRGVPR